MTKDEAEAIHALARLLLEEDVSVETRCRLARRIIEHARAIKASCMAEPTYKLLPKQGPITVTLPRHHSGGPVAPSSVHHENEGHELFQPVVTGCDYGAPFVMTEKEARAAEYRAWREAIDAHARRAGH